MTFTCPKTSTDFKAGVPLEEPEKGTAGSVSAELGAEAANWQAGADFMPGELPALFSLRLKPKFICSLS